MKVHAHIFIPAAPLPESASQCTMAGRERDDGDYENCVLSHTHNAARERAAAATAAAVLSQKLTFSRGVANHSLTPQPHRCTCIHT
jgi:hypothetical protein